MSADSAQLAALREQIDLFLAGQPSDAGSGEWVLADEDKARIVVLSEMVTRHRYEVAGEAFDVFMAALGKTEEGK